jgi:predicted metalloenzyme YecM
MITEGFKQFATSLISQAPIDLSSLELDHFGYQASSADDYETLKKEAAKISTLISEEVVSGRRVAIYRFNTPLIYKNYKISGFELVEPKEGQICNSELDHLEFVITEGFDRFMNKYSDIQWNEDAKFRKEFPKISVNLDNGKAIKFHQKNIFEEIPK